LIESIIGDEEDQLSPAQIAELQRVRAEKAENYQNEHRRQRVKKNKASQRHRCNPCNYNAGNDQFLAQHEDSLKHRRKINGVKKVHKGKPSDIARRAANIAAKRFSCKPCSFNGGTPGDLKTHKASAKHARNVTEAAAAAAVTSTL